MSSLPDSTHFPLTGGPLLRWGVLAPGGIARSWVGSLHANTDQRVVAVASRSAKRAAAFAADFGIDTSYGGYEQLVADPRVEAVYIAAPHSEHRALALLAIAAGKHVLIEKPIAVTLADAREIVEAARAAGVFAMEALWSRFLPQTTVVAQLLESGDLGEVQAVSADLGMRFDFDPDSRLFDPALGGGALLDLGVYPAWFAHFVLGAPETVTATGTLTSTGVDAQSTVILDYASGQQATVMSTLLVETPQRATISGTAGRIEFARPFLAPSSFQLISGDERLEWADTSGLSWGEGLCYEAAAVAQHVADGLTESPWHSLDDTLGIMAVLESARGQLGAR